LANLRPGTNQYAAKSGSASDAEPIPGDTGGKSPAELVEIILSEMNEATDARKVNKAGRVQSARDRQRAAQRRLALDFGAARGWRLSDSDFGIDALSRGGVSGGSDWCREPPRPFFDHSWFYRVGRRTAAIATHPYHVNEVECRAFAASRGLTVEFPADYPSWYYPGHSKLAVYIGPVGRASGCVIA
jgi:hypothetical protein